MRAILTGQVGLDKKIYLEQVVKTAQQSGQDLKLFHVGDRMYAEAPDVKPGRILDLPLSRLHTIRRSVFKDIIAESQGIENVLIDTHATFRWRHGLFRAFDFDQIKLFRPDMFLCLVDNVETVHRRLHREHRLDATLKDMMVWREEEILATELLALATDCSDNCFTLPRGRSEGTAKQCSQLVCNPEIRKVYPSFPMSHVVDMPDILDEIGQFRREIAEHMVAFDPADVDEKLLLESAIAAAKDGKDFIEAVECLPDGTEQSYQVSVKQVLEIAGDIDGQIYARDFKLIDQSDMIVSLVPELDGGVPGLSSGVERELHHAYEHGKEVYVVWKPKRPPSPFITETATKVFASSDEVIDYLKSNDLLTAKVKRESGGLFA